MYSRFVLESKVGHEKKEKERKPEDQETSPDTELSDSKCGVFTERSW